MDGRNPFLPLALSLSYFSRATPADDEREKAFLTAEILNKQLDDMSSQLSGLVEEINLTKSDSQEDNTMTDIIKI